MRVRNISLCRQFLKVKPEEAPRPEEQEGYVELRRQLFGVDLAICPVCSGPMIAADTIQPDRPIRAP